jgi:Tfp pilus assembly protein PilW
MKTSGRQRAAFTLIELLITLPLAAFLILVVVRTYIACARMIDSQRIRNNLNGSVRVCSDYVARDASMAGYGLRAAEDDGLENWVTWVSNVTNPVLVINGASTNKPDMLRIVGAFDRRASLAAASSVGDQTITVGASEGDGFNTTDKSLIYIGRTELARITAANSNVLTISTDHAAAQGLKYAYPTNAPVELVQVITYFVTNTVDYSYLVRRDAAVTPTYFGYSIPYNDILAADIEDLQVTFSNNCLTAVISGKSGEPDLTHRDPDHNDNYRRQSLTTKTYVRNL